MTKEEIMTNQEITLQLEKREVVRKRLAGLRKDGLVPAVVHDHGKDSILVMGDFVQMTKAYHAAGKHHPINLSVGSSKHLALIKDVDFDPLHHNVRHVVFQAIKQNEEVETEVPVVFLEGAEIPAERASMMVLQQLDTVQVKAFPRDLPDELVVDPSGLVEVGDSISVADLVVPKGVTLLSDLEVLIAVVEMPKDQIAEANAAAESLAEDAGKVEVDVPVEGEAPKAEEAKAASE